MSQAMGRPGASLRAVARAFGMSPATVGRSLDRVRESGRVILSQPSRDRRVAA